MSSIGFLVQILIYTLVPLLGVLFFDWDWRQILILYWLENITIGLKAIIGMARSKNESIETIFKYGRIAFFMLHYGIFTFVHGIIVFSITSGDYLAQTIPKPESQVEMSSLLLFWAVASIVQLVMSFVSPAPTATLDKQFNEPYRRIIPLHLAIIFGAIAVAQLGLPAGVVVVLIVVKLFVDILNYTSAKKSLF